MKKLSVTVGIPTYNEGKNILKITKSIFEQDRSSWRLDKLMIVDDASTDDSVKFLIDRFNLKILEVIKHPKRMGKPYAMNEIFRFSQSDIVIIFDADIRFSSKNLINKLLEGFDNKSVAYVSGCAKPEKTKTFIGKVLYAGVEIWNLCRKNVKNSDMYYSEGSIRAFKKSFYKKLFFPNKSADDIYPFLILNDSSKFYYAENAVVYYKLPDTLPDALRQNLRYLQSIPIQKEIFGDKMVSKYFVINDLHKLIALLKYTSRNLFWGISYFTLTVFMKVYSLLKTDKHDSLWTIASSTK